MKFNKVEKKVRIDLRGIVKYQLLTHCYLKHIPVSDADLDCLTLLAIEGKQELTTFCTLAYENNIFRSAQTVRNAITKAEEKQLIVKEGKSKKQILINPALNIQFSGNILLDYKFISLETTQS